MTVTGGRFDIDTGWARHNVGDPELRLTGADGSGVNAPELNTDAGKAALIHVLELCPVGTKVTLLSHHWDKYGGRFDGSVTLPDERDLAATMVADGFAVTKAY